MERFTHNKLVRDKIPEVIESSGGQYEIRVLGEEEFRRELVNKLTEEAKELSSVDPKGLVDEMADVLELLKALAKENGIDFRVVEEKQVSKREERGGFQRRLFLVWSSAPSGR